MIHPDEPTSTENNSANKPVTRQRLFSFGVITDTHIRAPQGDLSSPFPVNELANDRAAHAVQLLANQNTSFNIHLGDMVHPLPHMAAYNSACEAAMEIFKPLQPALYFVPGNHDIGDKPMPGLPAAAINDHALTCYSQQFGDSYYVIDDHNNEHHNCLFIVLNSSLINSGVSQAKEQTDWLESTLKKYQNKRIFLFLHYPLFINSETEAEHYDNLAEPGRTWLFYLIRKHNIELVLSGHVHHFFYNRINNTHLYTLPPTSFTRQDYAELFKIDPTNEFGRDDIGKYSVAVIDVYDTGYELRIIPTHSKSNEDSANTPNCITPPGRKKLTVHMRHAWYESIDLPYNGPMEEFCRKRARNDYLFMRLKQMGICDVRIPLHDIIDPVSYNRALDYIATGFRFHGFCPQPQLKNILSNNRDSLHSLATLECVTMGKIDSLTEPKLTGAYPPLIIGHAQTGAHTTDQNKPFAHSVSSGFNWSDHKKVLALVEQWEIPIHGLVFQIHWEDDLQSMLDQMQTTFSSLPYRCIANVRLSCANPALANFDDNAITERVKTLTEFTQSSMNAIDLQLDTAMDIDRGYSPRNGLIDRLGNLRPAGNWLSNN